MNKILKMTALAAFVVSSPLAFAQSANTNTNGTVGTTNQTTPHTQTAPNASTDTLNKKDGTVNSGTVQSDQDKWWHDRDVNNDGKISKDEYVKVETKDGKKTVEEAGREFDEKDKDGTGFIEASEFKAWFERMGDKVSGNK